MVTSSNGNGDSALLESLNEQIADRIHLLERLDELEIALENKDWIRVGWQSDQEFSRGGLRTIAKQARLYYLKNPLVNRGVRIQSFYVFGRGINVSAKDETINEVIQAFLDDKENLRELTGAVARKQKDIDLRLDGNLFFVFFTHPTTGKVRISSIDVNEIEDVICDPQNRSKVWFYKRIWTYTDFDLSTGEQKVISATRYYRDFKYSSEVKKIGDIEVDPNPVYHIKTGGFHNWRFGVSEVYNTLDWAKAYKGFLEDFSTVVKALAKFAWNIKVQGGTRAVAAAKTKLGTTFAASGTNVETNPPPVAGSTWIADNVPLDPVRTANSTTPAEQGKPIKLMVAAGFGLPDTFFGDTDTGNLATAKALDRPTELAFVDRQELWKEIYETILEFVVYQSVIAPEGKLNAVANPDVNEYQEPVIVYNGEVDSHIDVDFPPILERDTKDYITAMVSAFTLDGKPPSVVTDLKLIAKLMLTAIGVDDVDEIIDELYPEDTAMVDQQQGLMQDLNKSLEALREAIVALASDE